MNGLIALLQSKRFWVLMAGLIVAFSNLLFGLSLDPQRVFATCMLLSAWIIGETQRPAERKVGIKWPRLFQPPAVAILCMTLCLAVGCTKKPTPKPIPAPEALTAVEAATEGQLRLLASGYAESYAKVAEGIRTGNVKDTAAMREELVAVTRDARLAAEIPVLDELDAHFPQGESGEWPDRESVARYLGSVSDAYRRLEKRLVPAKMIGP